MCTKRRNLENYDILSPTKEQRREIKRKNTSDDGSDGEKENDIPRTKKTKTGNKDGEKVMKKRIASNKSKALAAKVKTSYAKNEVCTQKGNL